MSGFRSALRNRIVAHRRVRAVDLRPHPLNPHSHDELQRSILRGLLEEIGLARSVLAYVADADRSLPDPPLTLIDGHLRREELGDAEVEVEVLDVTDAEARALLLSLDPLVRLAGDDAAVLDELRRSVERDSAAVAALWAAVEAAAAEGERELDEMRDGPPRGEELPEAYYVLIECRDEAEQLRLLQRFQAEGLKCCAKMS